MSASKHVNIFFPLGTSDLLKQCAKERNQTVSALINSALLSRLGLTEWPDVPKTIQKYDYNPVSACVICGSPLPEGKARYCSEECKKKARAAYAREARRKRFSQSQPPED
mgnify:CR=1 FL=1